MTRRVVEKLCTKILKKVCVNSLFPSFSSREITAQKCLGIHLEVMSQMSFYQTSATSPNRHISLHLRKLRRAVSRRDFSVAVETTPAIRSANVLRQDDDAVEIWNQICSCFAAR